MKKERPNIDQALCNHARILMAGGATTGMAADMLGIGKSTVQKMRQAGFDAGKYQQMKQQEKEKAAKATVEMVYDQSIAEQYRKEQAAKAEEQCPGQMMIELPPPFTDKQKKEMFAKYCEGINKAAIEKEEKNEIYRFIAAMVDKLNRGQAEVMDDLCMKIDKLNDTLSQLVRALRKE